MNERFEVEFLEAAKDFLESLDSKTQRKVLYNIWKAKLCNDATLFKPLTSTIWEFRTLYNRKQIRLFAFWDKSESTSTLVIATHGMIKKTGKVPRKEIQRAEKLRLKYFDTKER